MNTKSPIGLNVYRLISKLCLAPLLVVLTLGMSVTAFASPAQNQAQQSAVLAAVNSSYAAVDAAMNAGNVTSNPAAASINAQSLLSSAQTHYSSSATGQALYNYSLSRVQIMRSWEATHSGDFSANHVWSSFKSTSTNIQGSQATVKGVETFHVDSTVKANTAHPAFSTSKQAAMVTAKKNGQYIGVGQVNHGSAQFNHTVSLSQTANGWTIEKDSYQDALEPGLAADHQTTIKATQPQPSKVVQTSAKTIPALRTGYTYQRGAAISFANRWWNSCVNSADYNCYENQGVDCANFVSESIYDGNGGNLPGDNTWYSMSGYGTTATFVNAPMLQSYLANNFAYDYYNDENYSSALNTDIVWEAPGDVVFYSWDGGPIIDHTAISVSADANGITQVDAHTENVYHWYWDLQGRGSNGYNTGATYWFVMLADSN